jgi:serine phosphatase RsbU (regulator of sigma subunit)
LLKEGVRDGAAARGVHDYLFAYRHGKVSATLDIASVDLRSRTLLVTRNAATSMLLAQGDGYQAVPGGSGPIGLYHMTRPTVHQLALHAGIRVFLYSDGVENAGNRSGQDRFDLHAFAAASLPVDLPAEAIADRMLQEAICRDGGRPADDMTVVALAIHSHTDAIRVRRLAVRVPLP